MNTSRHFLLGLFSLIIIEANGQNSSKLTVPSSPAFSILNFEPGAVMRPTTARELAADVLNAFDRKGNLVLNLGLEVTPYWMKSHPSLKRETYLKPNIKQTFLQSLSLSAATVKDSSSSDNKLGGGFRFKLFNGKPVDELHVASKQQIEQGNVINAINVISRTIEPNDTKQTLVDAIVQALQDGNSSEALIKNVKTQAEKIAAQFGNSPGDLKAFLDKLIETRVASNIKLSETISNLLYERKGFILEFAGATGYNGFDKSFEQFGLWGNASFSSSPANMFTLTTRYMRNSRDTSANNFDVGLGFLTKRESYNISIEAMWRNYKAKLPTGRVENEATTRFAVQASYHITKSISLSFSMGKDFDSPFISRSGLFSILGANYSLFSKVPADLESAQ